jgi:hypothetical protein
MSVFKNIKFLKNMFITTGITVLFGMYSIFHLYFYINQLEKKLYNLKKMELDDLKVQILKMNINIDYLTDRIIKLEMSPSELNESELNESELNQIELNQIVYNNDNLQYDEQMNVLKKIGDFTCIDKDELCEKDSDEDSIKSSVRSRSSSLSWVKKTLFG